MPRGRKRYIAPVTPEIPRFCKCGNPVIQWLGTNNKLYYDCEKCIKDKREEYKKTDAYKEELECRKQKQRIMRAELIAASKEGEIPL